VGAENLIRRADQGRCTRKNVGTCRATYVPHSVAPAVRQDPDGDLEILVSNPTGVFGTHRLAPPYSSALCLVVTRLTSKMARCPPRRTKRWDAFRNEPIFAEPDDGACPA
jgi:hypothetical protein